MAFVLAVAAFMASTAFGLLRLRAVSARARAISSHAMPAVIALATLRQRLAELVAKIDVMVGSTTAKPAFDLDRSTADIDVQAAAYETHAAALPGQREAWVRAHSLISDAMADARMVGDELASGDWSAARTTFTTRLRPSAAAADAQLWNLVDLNATEGERFAEHIDRVRQETTVLLLVLDALCAGLAVALTAAALGAVRRSTDALEARSHELELFAGRVAHDIRSPLSPVVFALQRLASDTALADPRRAMLDRASRSVGRITALVDDLLAFARTGGRADTAARASTMTAVRATVDEAGTLASTRSIDLRVDGDAQDAVVACPSGVLASLISNLVLNAIKYMGSAVERRIVVSTTCGTARARVEVRDTGPGLPAGSEDRVFEPYVRVDRTGQPGLGLGLATVKRLAEAYGGAAGVRSGPGGCTFWFELPVAAREEAR